MSTKTQGGGADMPMMCPVSFISPRRTWEVKVQGHVADRVIVPGAKVGQAPRVGEIVEIVPGLGASRYRVHWSDGHDSIFSPGPEATIDPALRLEAEWEATMAARETLRAARWRGFVAGVGREAAIAQDALA